MNGRGAIYFTGIIEDGVRAVFDFLDLDFPDLISLRSAPRQGPAIPANRIMRPQGGGGRSFLLAGRGGALLTGHREEQRGLSLMAIW